MTQDKINIVLFQPEIPPNTGNIIRLAANTGCTLHLIKPLGFDLSAKQLRRAGLDYQDLAGINIYDNLESYLNTCGNIYACSTKGSELYHETNFKPSDSILFGPETRGLPENILATTPHKIRIPMQKNSRSLNLSNAVAVILYEALRQLEFPDLN